MDTDSPLTLPSCGRRIIPRIVQSSHYPQISNVVADTNTDNFFKTLNIETGASLPRHSISGLERSCYEVQSSTQLSELIMSITRVAAELAFQIVNKSSGIAQQEDIRHNVPRITCRDIFHPGKTDSPKVYALCDASKDERNPIPKVVVVCLPPWRYRLSHLQDFVGRSTLRHEPASRTKPGTPHTTAGDLIWALTYDACFAADCIHFVISNYNHWITGTHHKSGIKKQWEVSQIIPFDNQQPPIPKMLIQHFEEALSPPRKVGVLSYGPVPSSEVEEDDQDGYPVQFQDIMNLEGFEDRLLALFWCQN